MEIPVQVIALIEEEGTQSPVVVLHDRSSNRILPIWVGDPEARAIAIVFHQTPIPRPLTHHLLWQTVQALGGKLARVVIDRLKEHTYFATLHVSRGQETILVDARPSDSIALALVSQTPLFVESAIMEKASQENPFPVPDIPQQAGGHRKIELTKGDLERMAQVLKKAQEREQAS